MVSESLMPASCAPGRGVMLSTWLSYTATWRGKGSLPGLRFTISFTKSAPRPVLARPTRFFDIDQAEKGHDHHPHANAHIDRRWRHRLALVLQKVRRFC